MKDKRKRDFEIQEAAKSKPCGALGGSEISPETHLTFGAVNARPPHRSADHPGHAGSHVCSRARQARSARPQRRLPGPPALHAPAPGPAASPPSVNRSVLKSI
jgi:hypothetical protein